jgi:hypothetical protein
MHCSMEFIGGWGFPTCWCVGRTPANVCDRIDAIYRKEISRTMPAALDDTAYRTELTYMAAVWLFTCLSWRLEEALKSDEKWGRWSIGGRLLWYLQTIVTRPISCVRAGGIETDLLMSAMVKGAGIEALISRPSETGRSRYPRHWAVGVLPTPAAAKPVGKLGRVSISARAQARMGWRFSGPGALATIGRVLFGCCCRLD